MTVETIYGYKLAVTKNSKRSSQAHMWPFDAQTTKISSVWEQKIKINPMSTMCPCVRMCVKLTISILNAIDALHQQKQWRVRNACECFSNTWPKELEVEWDKEWKNAILLQWSLYQLGSNFFSLSSLTVRHLTRNIWPIHRSAPVEYCLFIPNSVNFSRERVYVFLTIH